MNCISILFSISSFYDFARLSISENQTQNNDFYVKLIELIELAMRSNVLKYVINSQSNKDVKQSQHPPGHNSDEITNRILLVSSFVSFPFHLRHAYKEYYHLSDEIINEILKAPDKRMQR
jgi:hypothetical protein